MILKVGLTLLGHWLSLVLCWKLGIGLLLLMIWVLAWVELAVPKNRTRRPISVSAAPIRTRHRHVA